ncbi:hypothetical protein MKZ24_18295 [Paenibacillus sp. FSL R7-0297]|uniref:hypothetical protein n=1 Tax=unclassified Paenibacillus TaxID=185978 RepID=UPI0004F8F1F7|nr:hypothetical protein [Paenibacillus sp. FSL R5-0912]AIQ42129.1 hypothetical protein R50912_20295 [Paenibacillus sp. FSL R5-0912]
MGNIVRQVIHEWNPCGLLPEAPIDEFDAEIEKVVQSLTAEVVKHLIFKGDFEVISDKCVEDNMDE